MQSKPVNFENKMEGHRGKLIRAVLLHDWNGALKNQIIFLTSDDFKNLEKMKIVRIKEENI